MSTKTRTAAVVALSVAMVVVAALAVPSAAGGTVATVQDNETATATPTGTPTATATPTPTATTPTPTPRVGNASVEVERQVAVEEITIREITVEEGGYVVVKNSTGGIIGVSDYLAPGTSFTNYTVPLDEPRESNGVVIVEVWFDDGDLTFEPSQDNPYTTSGFPVRSTAFVTTEELTRGTATPTATPTTTGTTMGTMGTTDGTETTTDASTPGFTALLGVLALVGAALLALRRE
ncbi:MAG: PGF-CTERM sorting domain-containing protein [Halobaculum sp.]